MGIRRHPTTAVATLALATTALALAAPGPAAAADPVVAITLCQAPDYATCERYGVNADTPYLVPAPYRDKLGSARAEPAEVTCTFYKYENAMGELARITSEGTPSLTITPTSFRCTIP